jgi:hypothetical protein
MSLRTTIVVLILLATGNAYANCRDVMHMFKTDEECREEDKQSIERGKESMKEVQRINRCDKLQRTTSALRSKAAADKECASGTLCDKQISVIEGNIADSCSVTKHFAPNPVEDIVVDMIVLTVNEIRAGKPVHDAVQDAVDIKKFDEQQRTQLCENVDLRGPPDCLGSLAAKRSGGNDRP